MGRLLLLTNTAFILYLIHRHVFEGFAVSGPAWALLTTMQGAFVVWVVGPRVGQQIAGIFTKGLDTVKETANAEVAARRQGGTERTP